MMRALLGTAPLGFLTLCVLCGACSGVSGSSRIGRHTDAGADAGAADGQARDVDASRDPGDRRDAGLPSEHAARGKLRGVVYGVERADLRSVRVSAGTISAAADDTGFFFLDDALAGASAHVVASAPGYSAGHALVTIGEGETANVILWLTKLNPQTIDDVRADQSLPLGAAVDEGQLELERDSLATIYGTAPLGAVTIESATLPALGAPGGLWSETDGKRERIARLGMLEVRARQSTAELALKRSATLSFAIGVPLEHSAKDEVQIYRFDEQSGVFRPFTKVPYVAPAHAVKLKIDELGIYAAGEPLGDESCAKLIVADADGNPLAHAAIVYGSEKHGTQLLTDEAGVACLTAELDTQLSYRAFGRGAKGSVEVIPAQPTHLPAEALACGDAACLDLGLVQGSSPKIACLRGTLAKMHAQTEVFVSLDSTSMPYRFMTGDSFCIDARVTKKAQFTSLLLDCGGALSVAAPAGATTCSESGDDCTDLGTIHCCDSHESCDDGQDDDCDGRVDEGCDCGGDPCATARTLMLPGACCTKAKTCGLRAPGESTCYESEVKAKLDASCPNQRVDTAFRQAALPGCCREDDQCGVSDPEFGCVERTVANDLYAVSPQLSAQACSYQ